MCALQIQDGILLRQCRGEEANIDGTEPIESSYACPVCPQWYVRVWNFALSNSFADEAHQSISHSQLLRALDTRNDE